MKNNQFLNNLQRNFNLENIFNNARVRLTGFYFLIVLSVVLIFNIVIFGSLNLNKNEIFLDDISLKIDSDARNTIIKARNRQTEKQIFEAILILDFAIIFAAGWGSYWLARKTLEPLEKAHELQSQFVSDASHEIQTPVSTIQLETELILLDKKASKEDLRETLQSNLEEAKSLAEITKTLLELSQIQSKIEIEPTNLNEVVANRIEKSQNRADISFDTTKVFLIQANSIVVDEITTILIDNAIKYRLPNGEIEVKIFRAHGQAVLEVSNDSREFSKDELEKFFERFHRDDKSRTCNARREGHGLGLAIAQKLANSVDAQISARCEKIINKSNKKQSFKTIFKVSFKFSK